jgi:hypothetical protein
MGARFNAGSLLAFKTFPGEAPGERIQAWSKDKADANDAEDKKFGESQM